MFYEIIYKQLGGKRFSLMTGAKQFVFDEDSLRFRIPKAKSGINFVRIRLTPEDLYDVEFGKIRGFDYVAISEAKGVFCDQLVELFERETGMYCKL